MDLSQFEVEWREFAVVKMEKKVTVVTNLRSMLKRSRGIYTKGGYKAINFESANEDVDPMFISLGKDNGGNTFCLRWDDVSEKWENIGMLVPSNEWSANQLQRYWEDCAIQLKNPNKVWNFREIFEKCIGERYDGVCFVGRGRFDGENILIRLNCDKQLANYYDDQVCEKYNEDKDEWEYWGLLVKHVRMR